MWLLNRELIGRCVNEQNKIILYSLGTQQSNCTIQLNHIYHVRGNRLKKGAIITNNTRFAFRSSSALFYIFIQVSREMWHYDAYGYLQLEWKIRQKKKHSFGL